jgi:hypothetical protein
MTASLEKKNARNGVSRHFSETNNLRRNDARREGKRGWRGRRSANAYLIKLWLIQGIGDVYISAKKKFKKLGVK